MTNKKRWCACVLAALTVVALRSQPVVQCMATPAAITIYQGESLAANGEIYALGNKELTFAQAGTFSVPVQVLGVTVRTITVTVKPEERVTPGGMAVGMALYCQGLLVTGTSEVQAENSRENPGAAAGLQPGDLLLKANGQDILDSTAFGRVLDGAPGRAVTLTVRRGTDTFETVINPVFDTEENQFRLGLWLKDSSAGLGTVTFSNAKGQFVALGHAILDSDTGALFPLRYGELYPCSLSGIKKGQKGRPGELQGTFSLSDTKLGEIAANTEYGLYGTLAAKLTNKLYPAGVPIASHSAVQEGPASILACVEGDEPKEYQIEIIKVTQQSSRAPKSMVIKVTDPTLLAKTGGIVQGMSGSPILQNGKLVGAVTHVLVSDPEKGYGIFAEWLYNP